MKNISFIISMLAISIFSINAQDCNNYFETEGTDNDPGIYGIGDFSIDYSGVNQEVKLGVYGFFEGWSSSSQAGQTLFSVNGSDPIALSELTDFPTYINGVFVSLNVASLNDEYLPNTSSSWTSGTVKFIGAIDNITMTQFESGLLFSCVDILEEITGCDYQFEGDDPGFPGYIITNAYPFAFSGDDIEVSIGYFDYVPFEDQGSDWPSDDGFFSVNGSELISVGTIYDNQPYMIGDVSITIDTTAILEGMTSGTIVFSGEIDLIVTHQVESGINFICVEEQSSNSDCIDYTLANPHVNFPGIYGSETVSLDYDGTAQTIEIGIYGNFNGWDISPYNSNMFATTIEINGGSPVPMYAIMATGEYNMTEATIALDPTSLNEEYVPNATVSHTSGKLLITGAIENVTVTLSGSGLFYSCQEPNSELAVCEDLTITNGTEDFPGIYGVGDVTRFFDGNNQSVDLGIYGLFDGWNSGGQQSQTFFSVNGSVPVSLQELSLNVNYNINDVVINLDTTAIDESYFSSTSIGWTSGKLNFSGPVENIVMTQFESGLLFTCSSALANDYSACEDFTIGSDDPNAPGIYIFGDYTLDYDGSDQEIQLGIYGLFNFWNPLPNLGQANATFFTINGNDPISLETIYNNVPYVENGISINLNTTFLGGEFPLEGLFTSGTLILEGNIETIVMTQFESGLLSSCPETYQVITGCDYEFIGDSATFQGFINSGTHSFPFDGGNQQVQMGYFDYATWDQMGQEWPADQSYFSVNGSDLVSIDSLFNNQPFVLNDVLITVDTLAISEDYNLPSVFTSGTLTFTGEISVISTQQTESGIAFICTSEAVEAIAGCQDFTEDNNNPNQPGIYLIEGDYVLDYDSTHQEISLGVYGFFDWIDISTGQADQTMFTVNGEGPISLQEIYLNLPYDLNGIEITVDTTALNDDYPLADYWPSGTLIFTGHVDEIVMTQLESGLLFACTEPILEQEDCIDFTEDNSNPDAPGIYLDEGDYQMDFDSTHQEVLLGVYGFFDWLDISAGQADETFFSVNGSDSVSLETIYLNQPYVINDIEIIVDTASIVEPYPAVNFWPSGTVIFTGHIDEIVMTQFESGLLFSCSSPLEGECECDACACHIDADFSYINIGNYYSFVSSGTGTEYLWDFGDGNTSNEENPTHEFATPNTYNVCLTNFNLTDTCSITICHEIEVQSITPEANIITPNNDGFDDQVKLNCNNVEIYDRNGKRVAELIGQAYWNGMDESQNALPMGEYVLRCKQTDVITKVTVLR